MKRLKFPVFAALVLLVTGAFAAQSALADDTDPKIDLGSSTTGSGSAENYVWTYAPGVNNGGAGTTISFQNTSGTTWTSLDIVADYSTNGHTFTCGTTTVFTTSNCVSPNMPPTTATTASFDFSGGTGVAAGDYLVFTWTNWNSNSGSGPPTFNFTANDGGPTDVPEPSSIALLAIGLLTLFGLGGFARLRRTGIAFA